VSRPIHQAPSWVHCQDKDGGAAFAALTLDVCNGVQTCLQLMQATDIANSSLAGDEYPPILGAVDKERLLLLAQAAAHMLSERAWDRVEELNDEGRKEDAQ